MAETKYGKYIRTRSVNAPRRGKLVGHSDSFNAGVSDAGKEKRPAPRPGSGVYLNSSAFSECPIYVSIQRTTEAPAEQPFLLAHKHDDVDEIIMFVAAGPDAELGTTVTFQMGDEGEKHTFHETTVIYAPAGVTHGPMWYSSPFKEGKEFYLIVYLNQPDYPTQD
ncbi:hypothetical protein ACFLTB_06015 [Chloroflexota bacterium]